MELVKTQPRIWFNRVLSAKEAIASLKSMWPLLCLLACALLFHWLSGGSFLTSRNLSNLSRQVCINLTLAVGMTLVILTSGIDLSVGSVLALAGMVGGLTQVTAGWSQWGALGAILSALCAIGVGGLAGAGTGFAISKLKITPFIITLGMMVICRGLTLIISGAQAVAPIGEDLGRLSSDYLPPALSFGVLFLGAAGCVVFNVIAFTRGGPFKESLKNGIYGILFCSLAGAIFCGYRGIPYMVFLSVFCASVGMFALKYLRYGRFVYAIGGNREAAELSGVPVVKTLWITYFIMGCLAGLAGLMDIARVNGAVPSAGELAELDAIAAVVIGGTSLMGGIGSISGTLFGVLIMGILNNGMSLIGVSEHYQKVFKGIVIILAVYLDLRSKKK
jgi:D-xylose transport system permease protein